LHDISKCDDVGMVMSLSEIHDLFIVGFFHLAPVGSNHDYEIVSSLSTHH